MGKAAAAIALARPHFLVGGLLTFAIGAIPGGGEINTWHYLAAQLMVLAAQLAAHLFNEYADLEADRSIVNRTAFSGGSGVLVDGAISPVAAVRAAAACVVITLIVATVTATFSPLAALLGVVALVVSWAYSMPPLRLLSTGFGELATAITVAGLVPSIGALTVHGSVNSQLWALMIVLVCLQFAMLLAFEVPDAETDALADKRVLAVRIGERTTITVIAVAMLSALEIAVVFAVAGVIETRVLLGMSAGLVPVALTFRGIVRKQHMLTTFGAVATFALCGLGVLLALTL